MTKGVFSVFSVPSYGNIQNQEKKSETTTKTVTSDKKQLISKIKSAAPVIVPLAAIPITALITYKISAKNVNALKSQISSLTDDISKLQKIAAEAKTTAEKGIDNVIKTGKKDNAQIWGALLAAGGLLGIYKVSDMTDDQKKEAAEKISNRIDNIQNTGKYALNMAEQSSALSSNNLGRKYTVNYNGIQLLTNSDSINKNEQKYAQAINQIQNAAPDRLYKTPNIKPIKSKRPTLWSISSEFAPIKEGGLGSVPVEIQNNVSKLGINIPTFIPMYQQKGTATFRTERGQYFYTYKGVEMKVDKAASLQLDTYQNGRPKTETVEFYVYNSKDEKGNNKQLVLVKNDNYFNGTIYQTSEKTEEPEKFAFFSKAVYELAKSKEDINSVKDLKINNKKVFDSIKAPDAFILNDWQASPVAALMRYKAPMENAYDQLSDNAANKLANMSIITIGHNAMYQGSTRNNNDNAQRKEATTNILNTLFDNFAYDIVSNSQTKASEQNPEDYGLRNLDNVLLLNQDDPYANHTNLLNMGICLSDYFHPVSQNYAKEIISDNHPELAGELRWALNQKNNSGSLIGIINGNDFNNISIEAKKEKIISLTGITPETYNKSSNIDDVMSSRTSNKINFYNNYILPLSKKNDNTNTDAQVESVRKLSKKLEFVDAGLKTELPVLTDEELSQTPIITSVGRLVSQKGIKIMADAIKLLYDNWEKDFPSKPKPIFYISGQDGEGGIQRKYIEDLKAKGLSAEDSNRVIFAHGFAPMNALAASSDFFLLPSIFEPCGLTQGESFAVGTPVIASAVGGIVDTVNRNGKTNGILTDKDKPLSAQDFYLAMKRGLEIYFDDKPAYTRMVKDALDEDFSWIQKGKKGPVFDYLKTIGINTDNLPEIIS